MEIKTNDKIEITATAMILLLDRFGEELIEKVQDEEITDTRDIMSLAKDTVVGYFNEHSNI